MKTSRTHSGIFQFRLLLNLLFISAVLWQCGRASQDDGVLPAPTPAFTATPATVNPLQISFANTSGQARSYYWDFGDGTGTSYAAAPTYTYRRAGTYQVRLVTSGDGGAANLVRAITVTAPPEPVANFTIAIDETKAPLRVGFANTTTNSTDYTWDFGVSDLASDTSNAANPSFEYPQSGLYTVTLTARSVAGIFTDVRTLKVLVIKPSDLAGTAATGRSWQYDRTKGLSFDNGGSFSGQKSCEIGSEFIFFPDGRYLADNKGSEIQFPDCATVSARPISTWKLIRAAPDRFTLTVGEGSFLGDPTTNPAYTITNFSPTGFVATASFGFGPAQYRMVPK